MSSLQVGDVTLIAGRQVELLAELGEPATSRAFLVRREGGEAGLLWTGEKGWAAAVRESLHGLRLSALPTILAEDAVDGFARLLLTAPPASAEPFDDESWRAVEPRRAVDALKEFVVAIGALHEGSGWLHGVRRDELYHDPVTDELHLVAMPRLRLVDDATTEATWRDMRLVGELAYECFLQAEYPGGHAMAAMLQDRAAMAEIGVYPGLPQVLAGCVSPYGDLAYDDALELWEGLEQIRLELEAPLMVRVGASSSVGNYIFRKNNQDSCGYTTVRTVCGSRKTTLGFYCVADGIGGIEDGERASRLAVSTACEAFGRAWTAYGPMDLSTRPGEFARGIAKVVGQRLALEGEFRPAKNRGGTTFSGLLIAGSRVAACHVGDSRILLVREGAHIPLTRDHTLASILVELGELTEEEAAENDLSQRTISRFLSTSAEIELQRIDGFAPGVIDRLGDGQIEDAGVDVRPGDLFILTSDGTHGEVDSESLRSLIAIHREPQALADALVAHALEQQGRDNATALVVAVG